jgi:glycosyltransferase involved in cell wall biosynthesis
VTIFLISFLYPPLQCPASIRISKFVKYLTRLGWECVVVTGDSAPPRGMNLDAGLLDGVPSVKVIRLRSYLRGVGVAASGGGHLNLVKELLYNLVIPDMYLLWSLTVAYSLRRTMRRGDVVFTTLSPYSTALAGLLLKMFTGARWVMDYRDGWTTDPLYRFVEPRRLVDAAIEWGCLAAADGATCVSDPLRDDLQRAFGIGGKTTVIENGYDPEDSASGAVDLGVGFNIVYTGMISTHSRDITQLIYAVGDLARVHGDIRVYFVGAVYDTLGGASGRYAALVKRLRLENNVIFVPPVPHPEALAYQRGADALLLIISTKNPASVMSSKIFEYIQAGKPIIGLIGVSAARSLIEENRLGLCADPTNRLEIAEAILKIRDNPSVYPDESKRLGLMEKYSRRCLAEKLSRVLEGLN